MRIPEHKIEEIRRASDIVDIISKYLPLKKRGKNFITLCPFHNEKTPSFTVSQDKQIYHCFGCHAGGNVFNFLMEYKKISYVEAVLELAAEYGIPVDYEEEKYSEQQSETEELYEINKIAAIFFSDNLLKNEEGKFARKYFESRKIKSSTIKTFGLGYLPQNNVLVNHLKEKKVDLEKAIYLGLIGKNEKGNLFDKLYDRIIFPIFSTNGRIVAFAGRVLKDNENISKYINSPESKIYYKGKILYGLFFAKEEIRKSEIAIVVEGYMDLISLYQNNIKNVVAVSGTALTEDQIQLLSRYTKNVVLLFDADTAGVKASMRSIELLLKHNLNIKIAVLPEGEDPDSFVNKYGAEEFKKIINSSQDFLEFQTSIFEKEGRFDDAVKSTDAIRELMATVALINDDLKRNLLIKSLSDKFNLRLKLLEDELNKILKTRSEFYRNNRKEQNQKEQFSLSSSEGISPKVISNYPEKINGKKNVTSIIDSPVFITEREIVKLLYENDENLINLIFKFLNPDDFEFDIHRILAQYIFDEYKNENEINISFQRKSDEPLAKIIELIEDEKVKNYLLELTLDKYRISDKWEEKLGHRNDPNILYKITIDTIKKYKTQKIEEKIKEVSKQIEENFDEANQLELLKELTELQQEKSNINNHIKEKIK